MRVLVTGGAGFIGSHVVDALADDGHEVVAFDNLHRAAHGQDAQPPPGLVVGDIRDVDAVASALGGIDAVVHQAAMVGLGVDLNDLPEYVSCNDLGTAVLLAAMARAGIRRLVLASSMVVYGEGAYTCHHHGEVRPAARTVEDLAAGVFEPRCPHCAESVVAALIDEDAPLRPRSVYAATKLAQENLTSAWAAESRAGAVALRYHNVYGPGMPRDTPYAGVAAIFRSSLERGQAPRVFEDGGQRRDFIHVGDVAAANVAALHAVDAGPGLRPYNIASGEPHTVGEMAAVLAAACGGPAPVVTGQFRSGDVRHVTASPVRAKHELGFVAGRRFDEGMAEFATAALRV
jgi:dTDP-L-rhamnose 4-epimerase